jgi:hypothetical protein
MATRGMGCPLLFGSKVGVAHDPGTDLVRAPAERARQRQRAVWERLCGLEPLYYMEESLYYMDSWGATPSPGAAFSPGAALTSHL